MTNPEASEPPPHMTGHHRSTYETIFRHPVAHNVEWHDVRSLLTAIATVIEDENGSLIVTRHGKMLRLHLPKHKETPAEMVLDIRRFLAGSTHSSSPATTGIDLVVLIDHHEAKVYHTETLGSIPQRLVPYDPLGHGRHLHSAHEWTDGKRQPERKSYYEAVAKTLAKTGRVVVFGSGTGRSSAKDQLMADLNEHHPEIAAKVIAELVLDAHHTSEPQLLAEARTVFAHFDGEISPTSKAAS